MDRLEYNILLEEIAVYTKALIKDSEIESKDGNYIYKDTSNNKIYEIIPNDLTTEEIQVALLAKQILKLKSIEISIIIVFMLLLVAFFLIIFVKP